MRILAATALTADMQAIVARKIELFMSAAQA